MKMNLEIVYFSSSRHIFWKIVWPKFQLVFQLQLQHQFQLLFGFAWRANGRTTAACKATTALNKKQKERTHLIFSRHSKTRNGIRFQISHFRDGALSHCAKWVSAAKLKTLSVWGNWKNTLDKEGNTKRGRGGVWGKQGVSTCVQGCDRVWVCDGMCIPLVSECVCVCVWKNLKLFHEVKAK